jgi:hypothetical protein
MHALVHHLRFRFLNDMLVAPVTGTQAIVRLCAVFVNRRRMGEMCANPAATCACDASCEGRTAPAA